MRGAVNVAWRNGPLGLFGSQSLREEELEAGQTRGKELPGWCQTVPLLLGEEARKVPPIISSVARSTTTTEDNPPNSTLPKMRNNSTITSTMFTSLLRPSQLLGLEQWEVPWVTGFGAECHNIHTPMVISKWLNYVVLHLDSVGNMSDSCNCSGGDEMILFDPICSALWSWDVAFALGGKITRWIRISS